jgi:hypothetical protein
MADGRSGDFTYEVVDGKVVVTGYEGDSKEPAIPAEMDGMPVTAIRGKAFYGDGLTGITIPASVTAIGAWAFRKNLFAKVRVPASVVTLGLKVFDDHVEMTRFS